VLDASSKALADGWATDPGADSGSRAPLPAARQCLSAVPGLTADHPEAGVSRPTCA